MTKPQDAPLFKRSSLRSENKVRNLSASDLGLVVEASQVTLRPISIFPGGTFTRQDKLCFVLMPFAPELQDAYDFIIRPTVEARGLECRRADNITESGDILAQIYRSLMEARVVIADLTGANGNVLYELGLAHMMGHQAILLTQDIHQVPFDLRQQRHIIYSLSPTGVKKAIQSLEGTLTTALKEPSPIAT